MSKEKPLAVIVGSEGWLGRWTRMALSDRYRIRRVDLSVPNTGGTMRGEVRNQEDMEQAVENADIVFHFAAIHGGYHPAPTDEARFDTNVRGTFRMFQACKKKGVRKVVWASSIAAMSNATCYSMTKVVGEDLCNYYSQGHGFSIVMLRYGSFTPFDFVSYGERLFGQGIDVRDCASAAVHAGELVFRQETFCNWYTLVYSGFFSSADRDLYRVDRESFLESHHKGAVELSERYGMKFPQELGEFDASSTRTELGFTPSFTIAQFFQDLTNLDKQGLITPEKPRWTFEKGIEAPADVVWPPGLE